MSSALPRSSFLQRFEWGTSARLFLNDIRAGLAGIIAGCAGVALFAILSSFALSDARLGEVIKTAFAKHQLEYAAHVREDFFMECVLLTMQQVRHPGIFFNALDTRLVMREGELHPCESLRMLALGTAEERASLPEPASYYNYPWGVRHLEAFVLSVLDFEAGAQLYRALSYGTVLLLFAAMLWRSPAAAMMLAPIPLALIGAFAVHRFGGNLMHAPGFFVGFAALALFVGAPRLFRSEASRFGFVGALGAIAAYFDGLNGPIATLLALTILLNHFFYLAAERHQNGYLAKVALQPIAIFACFLLAYVISTLARLGLLWINDVDVSGFLSRLAVRTARDIGMPVSFRLDLNTLFAFRSQLTLGGAATANWVFLAGIAGWIFTGLIGLAAFAFRRSLRTSATIDVLVLAAVSIGVLGWYWCFLAHTFIHAAFMVRLLALPLACGLAAGLLAARDAIRDHLPRAVVPVAVCIALGLSALFLHSRWTIGTAVAARLVEAPADLVSCGKLGLKPDGKPDGVVEVSFETVTPPLTYLGLKNGGDTTVLLARRNPDAAYHTGAFHNVLGITTEPGGPLLNRTDGGFRFAGGTQPRIFGHFCRDGDQPGSRYELLVDGVGIPISP